MFLFSSSCRFEPSAGSLLHAELDIFVMIQNGLSYIIHIMRCAPTLSRAFRIVGILKIISITNLIIANRSIALSIMYAKLHAITSKVKSDTNDLYLFHPVSYSFIMGIYNSDFNCCPTENQLAFSLSRHHSLGGLFLDTVCYWASATPVLVATLLKFPMGLF